MSRTFAYLRVSKEDQKLELQRDAILSVSDCAFIIEETASGKNADRPELKRMIEQLLSGDVVVVWKLIALEDPPRIS